MSGSKKTNSGASSDSKPKTHIPGARGASRGPNTAGGKEGEHIPDRNADPIWEITDEDTSLAAGDAPDIREGTTGGEAGSATSGPGSSGSKRGGQAVS